MSEVLQTRSHIIKYYRCIGIQLNSVWSIQNEILDSTCRLFLLLRHLMTTSYRSMMWSENWRWTQGCELTMHDTNRCKFAILFELIIKIKLKINIFYNIPHILLLKWAPVRVLTTVLISTCNSASHFITSANGFKELSTSTVRQIPPMVPWILGSRRENTATGLKDQVRIVAAIRVI
jgi:hypothetical protein